MTSLVIGLVLFIGIHLIPAVSPSMREQVVTKLGAGAWKGVFSIGALVGLYLIATGYGAARLEPVWIWYPPAFLSHLTALLMLVAFIFVAAALVPGNAIKARVGHPMLIGVKTWALGHLLVNGTLADLLMFGTFLSWGVFSFIKHRKADRAAGIQPPVATGMAGTLIAIALGVVATAIFALWLHPVLIGVPAIIRS